MSTTAPVAAPAPTIGSRLGARRRDQLLDRLGRVSPWGYLLFCAIVLYTWYFTDISIEVHNGLGTSAYDSALYDQGVWLLSRFKAPFVTLMGRNLFGDHASFVMLFLVPVYWVYPHTEVLFFTQSLAVALGAVPVYLLARRRLGSGPIALVLGLAYLVHPAVTWVNRENFHPDAYLGVFVGMAIFGALERKWRTYLVFTVLAALVKEDVSLILVPLGVWVALRRDWRYGLATIAGSVTMTVFGMFVVMRSLIGVPTRNTWRIPFGGPSGLVRETLERPGNLVEHLRSDGRPFYLWQMGFPFAFVFARLPSVALIGALVLFTNVLSTFWYQYHLEYHYSLVPVPALALGTVWAIGAMRPRSRRWSVGVVAVTALWSALAWGALPLGKLAFWMDPYVGDKRVEQYWRSDYVVPVAAHELMAAIPDGAVVSAQHALTAHLAHREQVYMFPNPFRVKLYGPNTDLERRRACLAEVADVEYVMIQAALNPEDSADWDRVRAAFVEVARNDYFVLYRRADGAPRAECVGERLVVTG